MKKFKIFKALFAAAALAFALPSCSDLSSGGSSAQVAPDGKVAVSLSLTEGYRSIISSLSLTGLKGTLTITPTDEGTTETVQTISIDDISAFDNGSTVAYLTADATYKFGLEVYKETTTSEGGSATTSKTNVLASETGVTKKITASDAAVSITLVPVTDATVAVALNVSLTAGGSTAKASDFGVKSVRATVYSDASLAEDKKVTGTDLQFTVANAKDASDADIDGSYVVSGTITTGATRWVKIELLADDETVLGSKTVAIYGIPTGEFSEADTTLTVAIKQYKATVVITSINTVDTTEDATAKDLVLENTAFSDATETITYTAATKSTDETTATYTAYVPYGTYKFTIGNGSGNVTNVKEVTVDADKILTSISVAWNDDHYEKNESNQVTTTAKAHYVNNTTADDLLKEIKLTKHFKKYNESNELVDADDEVAETAVGAKLYVGDVEFNTFITTAIAGNYTIIVKYNEKEATLSEELELKADEVSEITAELNETGSAKTWAAGDTVTASDVTVTATWASGVDDSILTSGYTVSATPITAGTNVAVTVTLDANTEVTTTVTIPKVIAYVENGTYNLLQLASALTNGAYYNTDGYVYTEEGGSTKYSSTFTSETESVDTDGIWQSGWTANNDWAKDGSGGATINLRLKSKSIITLTSYAGTAGLTVKIGDDPLLSAVKTSATTYAFYTTNSEPAIATLTFTKDDYVKTITVADGADAANSVESITISGYDTDAESKAIMTNDESYTLKATLTNTYLNDFSADVTWSTEAETVATIDATTGKVTFVSTGDVTFTATAGGKTASVTVTVSEASNVIDAVWDWTKLSTEGGVWLATSTDGGKTLTEAYDDSTVPSYKLEGKGISGYVVNSKNLLIPVSVGNSSTSAKLTATGIRGQFKTSPASLSVPVSANSVVTIVISSSNQSLKIAGSEKKSDSNGKYTWSNETGKTGYILVEQTGTQVYFYSITVTNLDKTSLNYTTNVAALPSLSISAANDATSVKVAETLQLTATPSNFTDTPTITWKSSDSTVAEVSNTGLVTGKSASDDSVTITATATYGSETATATYSVKVKAAGSVTATTASWDFTDNSLGTWDTSAKTFTSTVEGATTILSSLTTLASDISYTSGGATLVICATTTGKGQSSTVYNSITETKSATASGNPTYKSHSNYPIIMKFDGIKITGVVGKVTITVNAGKTGTTEYIDRKIQILAGDSVNAGKSNYIEGNIEQAAAVTSLTYDCGEDGTTIYIATTNETGIKTILIAPTD